MNNQSFSKIWILVIILIFVAGGIWGWQYFGAPKEETWTPEELTKETAEDETADWKTYRNEEYGFEIKYPPNCLIDVKRENEDLYLGFSGSTGEDFDICTGGFSARKNKKGLPLEEWLLDLYSFPELKFDKKETSAGIIALTIPIEQSEEFYEKFGGHLGFEAPEEIEYEWWVGTSYWITANEQWVFSLFHFQDGGLLGDEMLATFRFLE